MKNSLDYSKIYRPLQNLIFKIFHKRNMHSCFADLIKSNKYDHIIDIGGADGVLLNYLKDYNFKSYTCIEPDKTLIENGIKKNIRDNVFFLNKGIERIDIDEINKPNTIIVLVGVIHHINDEFVVNFLKKISNQSVLTIDGFFYKGMHPISYCMKKLDRGDYIRNLDGYKKILKDFFYEKKINYFFRYFSHVIFFKNIKSDDINKFL